MASSLRILYQDNHLIVIDKPPLLATMGALKGEPNLAEQVKDYLRRTCNKPGNVYLGIVSRLDAFSSGVIVFARTSKAAGRLSAQFRTNDVFKQYLAITDCPISPASGRLLDWIRKDDDARKMVRAKPTEPEARRAELEYETIGSHRALRLLRIELVTGRKHQIRVQLSLRGSPILGDRKYGSRQPFGPGIALHAHLVKLTHPVKKQPLTFVSLPGQTWDLDRFGWNPGKAASDLR